MLQTNAYALKMTIANAIAQSALFVSLATFYARPGDPGETVDSIGAVDLIPADYTEVSGLTALRCMFAPQSVGTPNQRDTIRTGPQYDSKTEFHLLLAGFFPSVEQRFLVKVDDGEFLEVMGVEHDSQSTQTRCAVRTYVV